MYYSEIEGRPNYPLFELSKEIENTLENQGNLEDHYLKTQLVNLEIFISLILPA